MKAEFVGPIKNRFGTPIQIDGLWGIIKGCTCSNDLRILFAAGPQDESLGLIGLLREQCSNC